MTRALVLDQTGWRYRGGSLGDPHVFSDKQQYETAEAVNTVVDRELVEASAEASTVAMAGEYVPRSGQPVPFGSGMQLGDAVSAASIDRVRGRHRLVSWRVGESAGGTPSFRFELNSTVDDDVARHGLWLERATPGAMAGRADSTGSVAFGMPSGFRQMSTSTFLTANQPGYLLAEIDPDDPEDEGRTDVIEVTEPVTLYRLNWTLQQAGDTETEVHMRVNGSIIHVIEIPAGEVSPTGVPSRENGTYTNAALGVGDRVQLAVYQAGDYARGLVVKVMSTSQA